MTESTNPCDKASELGTEPLVQSNPAAPPAEERRQHKRIVCDLAMVATEITPEGDIGACWECRVIEVSDGGCRFLTTRMVPLDGQVLVQIFSADGKTRRCMFGHVRHVKAFVRGRQHLMGMEFGPMPETAVVRQWLRARAA